MKNLETVTKLQTKLTIVIALLLLFGLSSISNAQNVNIPDANFKALLVGNPLINTNGDAEIQETEAMTFAGRIDVHNQRIRDLRGIEAFRSLTELFCHENIIDNLDVSTNTALKYLSCGTNSLNTLNLNANPSLTDLECSVNSLTSLDLSANLALKYLDCSFNDLTHITIPALSKLGFLNCSYNQFKNLHLSGSGYVGLKHLDCSYNQLTSLDISANPGLIWLYCNGNQLTSLNGKNGNRPHFWTRNNPNLTCIQVDDVAFCELQFSLDTDPWTSFSEICTNLNAQNVNIPDANFKALLVSNPLINTNGDGEIQVDEAAAYTDTIVAFNKSISNRKGIEAFSSLTVLDCAFNQLTNLDISANSALKELNCTGNQLANFDVSENTALSKLYCGHNLLTSLDVSANTALEDLYCHNNRITNLNANTFLKYLQCTNNQLTSLDLSANHALEVLNCNDNLLTSLDLPVNSALSVLFCQRNQLTSLDVSGNAVLTIFECSYNQLTSLDISTNSALVSFICSENQLTRLNAKNGNPTHFRIFMASYNPNLTCIQVDDVAYSTSNWHVNYWTSFSETCTVGIDNVSDTEIHIFPNPSNGNFTIDGLPLKGVSITIYNLLGELVYSGKNNQTVCNIDISNSPKGLYFVKVSDGKKIHSSKIEVR